MFIRATILLATLWFAVGSIPMAAGQTVHHVDDDALAGGNGATWATAFRHLRDALAEASAGDEIRVAGGIYRPDQDEAGSATPGDRTESFQIVTGATLAGGYRGCPGGNCAGGDPNERNLALYETVLSGDLAGDDVADLAGFLACYSGSGNVRVPECAPFDTDSDLDVDAIDGRIDDNSYHVVVASGTTAATTLDGFVIKAGNADGPAASGQDKGGGIYNDGGALTVTRCTIVVNAAELRGAGAYNLGAGAVMTECDFNNNRVLGNSKESGGGGLFNSGGNPTVSDCGFTGNIAPFAGGGLMVDVGGGQQVVRCTFTANVSFGGAGLSCVSGHTVVEDCTFTENHALHAGGGIDLIGDSLTVQRCRFERNLADTYGGAMFTDNNVGSTFVDCTFIDNTAIAEGGALSLLTGTPTRIINSRFFGNVADRIDGIGSAGGAIALAAVDIAVTNCLFSGNLSERGGAVEFVSSTNSTLTFDGCTFTANTALDSGGGLFSFGSSGVTTLRNCILWKNTDPNGSGVSAQISAMAPNVFFSVIQDDDPNDASIPFGGAAQGNIDDAPIFVDADGPDDVPGTEDDDLRLAAGSPCIDAGDSSAVPPDLDDIDGDGDTAERTPHDLGHDARFVDDLSVVDSGVADPPDYPQVVDMGALEAPGVGGPIPAVSEWGMGVMLLLLLTAATLALGRRGFGVHSV